MQLSSPAILTAILVQPLRGPTSAMCFCCRRWIRRHFYGMFDGHNHLMRGLLNKCLEMISWELFFLHSLDSVVYDHQVKLKFSTKKSSYFYPKRKGQIEI